MENDEMIKQIQPNKGSVNVFLKESIALSLEKELVYKQDKLNKVKEELKESNLKLGDEVTVEDIASVVSNMTKIPLDKKLTESENKRLLKLGEELQKRVVGQNRAVDAIVKAVQRSRVVLGNQNRPLASFMFMGPTGVGKTELAKALAYLLFHTEKALVRFDMSAYKEKHAVARLIGPPPGYMQHDQGGQLTEIIRRRPYSIILFDEIEKAHEELLDVLLPILDEGEIMDAAGRLVNFTNTVIIMTSNVGSEKVLDDKNKNLSYDELRKKVMDDARSRAHFKPEFINRIDKFLVFESLTADQLQAIVRIQLKELGKKYASADGEMKIEGTPDAMTLLANVKEEDKRYGARPVRRMIQEKVEDQLVERILRREFGKGDTIYIDTVSSSSSTTKNELYFMKLLPLGEELRRRVVGQEHAVEAVVKVVQRSREVAGNNNRPKASFMFVGPAGVGKKELARALAYLLFNTEEAVVLFDMRFYTKENAVSRLIENFLLRNMQRRGHGSQLAEAVRHSPDSVILFDGIDKAHPQIQQEFLLPILKEGKITDAEGRLVIDLTNAVIIMTSSVASDVILREAHDKPPFEELKKNAMAEAARSHSCFKPEFIKDAGIDEFIVFLPLSTHHIEAIVRLQLNKLEKSYASTNHKIKLEATPAAIKLLANLTDNDKKYGARSVVRVINKKVADQLVERINIRGEFESGDTIYIDTVTSSSSTQELSFKKLN